MADQQPGSKLPAEGPAKGVTDHHQRDAEAAAPFAGKLGNHGVRGRKHAADTKARENAPGGKHDRIGRRCGAEHSRRHDDQTADQCRPAAHLVSDSAEQDGADAHPDQLHRQHDAESGLLNSPLLRNARRGEGNGQDIKSVHGVQQNRHTDHNYLCCGHLRPVDDFTRIVVRHGPSLTQPGLIRE